MRVQLEADEFGSLGVEIDADGTVSAFTHRGSVAETSGLPLGGQIVGVNGERVFGAAAIHAAVEAGAPGPFDLEVRVAPITRSARPPQLPPDDLPPPQLLDGPTPPMPPPDMATGYTGDGAAPTVKMEQKQMGAGAETEWQRVMSGAWWDPAQQRTKSSTRRHSGAVTEPVTATDPRPQRHSRSVPVGKRYSGASSSSDSDNDDGHRARSHPSRSNRAIEGRSRRSSRSSTRVIRDDNNRRSESMPASRLRQHRHHHPADTVRQTHREDTSRPDAALQAGGYRNVAFASTSRKLPSSSNRGVSTARRDTGNDGFARGDWAVEEQQHHQQQYTSPHRHQQRQWQHVEIGDNVDNLVSSPGAAIRAGPQGTRSHGYSKSSLVPDHGSWYAHEDVLPMNRRSLAAEQGEAWPVSARRDSMDRHTNDRAHTGARKFTEEDEVSESIEASRQAAPRMSFDDRSRVALGVDPHAAGYGRSAGTRGGENDRAPPPDWSRTHAGRGFPDMLDADEPF